VYARREVELIQLVKHLLYTEKYTIDGARQKLEEFRKGGAVRPAARAALEVEVLESVERDLLDLMQLLADPAGTDAGTDGEASPGVSRAS
jgi:hypothetical protein